MKKYLVVYYSKSGNNRYLAQRISKEIDGDLEELKPRLGLMFFMLLSILTKISFGNRTLENDPSEYEKVIVCAPIWAGAVIPPIRDFLKMYNRSVSRMIFVTCCGSSDDGKYDKFGYGTVFPKLEKLVKDSTVTCEAFPIGLTLNDSDRENDDAMMKAKLNDGSFVGPIKERFDKFISDI